MKTHRDPEWNLTIGVDTVRLLAVKAQAVSADLNTEYEDGHEHRTASSPLPEDTPEAPPVEEDHHPDALAEEETGDATDKEFQQLVADLNVDEAAELVAIAWIGRGDYESAEWNRVVPEARAQVNDNLAEYLLGMPLLGDYLSDGLNAIGA